MLSDLVSIISTFVLETIESWGVIGVFVLMTLESANIPIPSEVIMPFSGFLVGTGVFSFWVIVFVGAFGNLVGSIISYFAASKLDGKIRSKLEFKRAERWFNKFGVWSVFIARLLPIVRTFISFPAGMFKVNIWKFSALTFAGSLLWSWVLTRVGFILGENWSVIEPYFRKFDFAIAGGVLAGVAWRIWHHRKKMLANRR
ncbi:MAG: hypothetical protein A3C03_02565 [Candidatus Colwellbacteria bacterium RIFCSPHIGHO2_02_FULL_45_17]|uniref:SNARE associated protein n=2 Tax=environmental samples TaxID=221217 RepID=A0A0H4TX88_9BACT|nr:SNARE associated protein [uncultured Parcubacteria bacterium Rifle_16ft_4_minimus_37647]AKQ05614.1 SNARE associated protein [uncultured Parcubacteria bacterium Rifle_16ft_4_minimus_23790]OGY58629.1 MAG: hypothetical protein A3C03_02565 [Candidatus Colwellbacteria bacterium RIFCSPHIGHO2_02_FULL_45_17]